MNDITNGPRSIQGLEYEKLQLEVEKLKTTSKKKTWLQKHEGMVDIID